MNNLIDSYIALQRFIQTNNLIEQEVLHLSNRGDIFFYLYIIKAKCYYDTLSASSIDKSLIEKFYNHNLNSPSANLISISKSSVGYYDDEFIQGVHIDRHVENVKKYRDVYSFELLNTFIPIENKYYKVLLEKNKFLPKDLIFYIDSENLRLEIELREPLSIHDLFILENDNFINYNLINGDNFSFNNKENLNNLVKLAKRELNIQFLDNNKVKWGKHFENVYDAPEDGYKILLALAKLQIISEDKDAFFAAREITAASTLDKARISKIFKKRMPEFLIKSGSGHKAVYKIKTDAI